MLNKLLIDHEKNRILTSVLSLCVLLDSIQLLSQLLKYISKLSLYNYLIFIENLLSSKKNM